MDDKSTTTTILLSIISILFFIISAIDDVSAQNQLAVKPSPPQADDDSATDFQPSLAVVIALLSIMFSLTFILLLYAKFRRRRSSSSSSSLSRRIIQDGLLRRPSPPPSGVEKSVVESLPFFRFSSLRGPTEGLECAVCLARFNGTDVLRMLPKCKHAFHIDCIDRWLEKRDTCPLCRCRAEPNDVVGLDPQCSEGFPWDQPDHHGYSNLELYVEREEYSSSFGSKSQEEELSMQINNTDTDTDTDADADADADAYADTNNNRDRIFHKLNHKINVVSSINNVLKNRWSDVSSSDMLHLNSEMMLADVSNSKFLNSSNLEKSRKNDYSMMNNIKEEMERKRVFESKVKEIKNHTRIVTSDCSKEKRDSGLESDTRSVSEIKVHPRFRDQVRNISGNSDLVDEEEVMRRRVWLQIARRTIQWFANREEPRPSTQINV